jgi:hypothetical protein
MGNIEALAKSGGLVAYFGYGSLVNRNTLRTNIVHAGTAAWLAKAVARPPGYARFFRSALVSAPRRGR